MKNTIRITESQFNRLFKTEDINKEIVSPLREILKCRITEDRKYVTYLGRVYDGVTGEELPLTEQALGITKALGTTGKVGVSDDDWSLSDILHTGVDLVSTAADFIIPGSGAIIDIVHALSYIVEAQYSSGEEQDTLYLMAAITGMFAILPGALQAVAPILKRFVSSGGKMALKDIPKLKGVWDIVSKNISKFLSELPKWVDKAVNSPIGKKLLGGNVVKISSAIKNFSTRIKGILYKLKSKTARLQSNVQKSVENLPTKIRKTSSDAYTFLTNSSKIRKTIDALNSNVVNKFIGGKYTNNLLFKTLGVGPAAVRQILTNILEIFVKDGKDWKLKAAKAVGYYIWLVYITRGIHDFLCRYGIKNTKQLKNVIDGREKVSIDADMGETFDMSIKTISYILNTDWGLGFIKRLFLMQDCSEKSDLPSIGEFIGYADEAIEKSNMGDKFNNQWEETKNELGVDSKVTFKKHKN